MGTQGARERRRVGMVGWSGSGCVLRGQRLCVCMCVCVCVYVTVTAVQINVLLPCKNKLSSTHTHTHYSHSPVLSLRSQDVSACFQVIKVGTATVGLKADEG